MKQLEDLNVKGKSVFLRVDFNVPLDDAGEITSDARIRASLPTIRYLLTQKAKIIICSHLGRPKGKVNPKLSLKPVSKRLGELLDMDVILAPDVVGREVDRLKTSLREGNILLLENIRFHIEETENDPEFSRLLAKDISCYINDAFSSCHRTHASVVGITRFVRDRAAGYLLRKEVEFLQKAIKAFHKPYVAILGGSKVSDKIAVIENLINKADAILIGGAMAYTFLKAQGRDVGKSFVEEDKKELALSLMEKAEKNGVRFCLPIDHVLTSSLDDTHHTRIIDEFPFPPNMMAVDIGPKTSELYSRIIGGARTIIWNGPLGIFEKEAFSQGTLKIAEAVAISDATSIIGGGDSEAAVAKLGLSNKITHISLGGGATLEYLAKETLPGLEALEICPIVAERPRLPFIAGNWKMHKTLAETRALVDALIDVSQGIDEAEIVVAPPFTSLVVAKRVLEGSDIQLSAQNIYWEDEGAFTGEVSGAMLKDIGCRYCIIGHSERRLYFGETDAIVNRKIKAAFRNGLIPIVCLGETLEERDGGKTMVRIRSQFEIGFDGVGPEDFSRIVTAYEPVWAIGTGKNALPSQAEEVHAFLRKLFEEKYGNGLASCAIILYGGSVKAANAYDLLKEKNIDGFLVGGASLEAASFVEITKEAIKAYKEKK